MTCIGFAFFFVYMTCTQTAPAPSGASFCSTYRPILWSAKDSRKTKEQADKMNRVYRKVCRK